MKLSRSPKERLCVLIVDDERAVRFLLADILSSTYRTVEADSTAGAIRAFHRERPDIVLSDIRMPGDDGIVLLQTLRALDPTLPVVMLTGHAEKRLAIDALRYGAQDFLEKPCDSATILETVARAADRVMMGRLDSAILTAGGTAIQQATLRPSNVLPARFSKHNFLIAIGGSLGGPEAVTTLLLALPPELPPIVVCLHMRSGYTMQFASILNGSCPFRVEEAASGIALKPGHVYIAPGGTHTTVVPSGTGFAIQTSELPSDCLYKPSVDVFMHSVAVAAKRRAAGIILTGMGTDGASGLLAMRSAGAATLAQNAATSAIYGMPRKAVEVGAVEKVVSLAAMPRELLCVLEQRIPR